MWCEGNEGRDGWGGGGGGTCVVGGGMNVGGGMWEVGVDSLFILHIWHHITTIQQITSHTYKQTTHTPHTNPSPPHKTTQNTHTHTTHTQNTHLPQLMLSSNSNKQFPPIPRHHHIPWGVEWLGSACTPPQVVPLCLESSASQGVDRLCVEVNAAYLEECLWKGGGRGWGVEGGERKPEVV